MAERGKLIRTGGPQAVRSMLDELNYSAIPDLEVEGSDGAGLKSKVPWFRVFSRSKSPKPTDRWYLAYLFAADGSEVALSLNHGSTQWDIGTLRPRNAKVLASEVAEARRKLTPSGLATRAFPNPYTWATRRLHMHTPKLMPSALHTRGTLYRTTQYYSRICGHCFRPWLSSMDMPGRTLVSQR
jgi:MrcB-like, N-terminal domain